MTCALAALLLWVALQPQPVWQAGPTGADKLQHIASFGAMIIPIALLRPANLALAGALLLGIGGMIELVQPLVGREGSWFEMGANGLGIGLGFLTSARGRRRAEADGANA